jgi:hypothetical protein
MKDGLEFGKERGCSGSLHDGPSDDERVVDRLENRIVVWMCYASSRSRALRATA